MTAKCGFTVLIAAKDAEGTIGRAIGSVGDEADAIIVIDHGSKDHTVEAARTAGGARVRIVSGADHRTLGAVRQAGLAEADTRFAAWLDADDEYLSGRVARLQERLERGDVMAAADATLVVDTLTGVERHVPLPDWVGQSALAARLFERNLLPAIGLIGFDVSAWRHLGYDARFQGAEDVDIALRAIAHGMTFGWISEPGTRVHVRPESLSRRRDNQRAMYRRALQKHSYPVVRSLYAEAGWDPATTCWGLSSMALFRGEGPAALTFLDEAMRHGVNGWPMAFARGAAYLLSRDLHHALASLRRAEDLLESPEAANNLGVAHAMLGAAAEARRWFEASLERFRGFEDPQVNLKLSAGWRVTTHPLRSRS